MAIGKIIVGLGNPDRRYAGNRHNVGFMIVDELAARYGAAPWSEKYGGDIAKITVQGQELLLVKPQSYMNLSGEPVAKIMQFYKVPPQDLWVMHDELDLPFGEVRTKFAGGTAGHNGLKSLCGMVGDKFYRLRFGIGRPPVKDDNVISHYVLSDFDESEKPIVEKVVKFIGEKIDEIVASEPSTWNFKA